MSPKPKKKEARKRLSRKELKKSRGGLTGSYVVPKPGEGVVVAFESGDLSRPVVIGSILNGMSSPPVQGK